MSDDGEATMVRESAEVAAESPFCMQGSQAVWESSNQTYRCESCPVGFFSSGGIQAKCLACKAGESSLVGAAVCTACPAGHTSDVGGACLPCEAGKYALEG